jgi:hypothetical protein
LKVRCLCWWTRLSLKKLKKKPTNVKHW